MGLLMFSAILTIVGSLVADIVVALVDPRIRLA
jgi:peptide/nickel transport system permease protein